RLIALESFEEDCALRVLGRVADGCGLKLIRWTVASGIGDSALGNGGLESGLRALAEIDEPALFVLLDCGRELEQHEAVRHLRDLLPRFSERDQTVVLLGPCIDLPLELAREAGRVSLPLPTRGELQVLLERVIEGEASPIDPTILESVSTAASGLTVAESVRVVRKALALSGGLVPATAGHVAREKRQVLRRTPALTFHDSNEGLDQVGGLGELKRWLSERHEAFGERARRFGIPQPRGLLLLGVQGCGKSLSAKAVAQEWQFPLLRLDLAAVFAGGDQSPEQIIREATSITESIAPVVLWIDEIEKGFAASGSDGRAARVLASFLTWMAEKKAPVFVVATANDISSLPPELLRRGRFDELFFVDLPSHAERMEIFSIHLRARGRDPEEFDLEQLAEESQLLSGAEIEQVIGQGLYSAFSSARELLDTDIVNAIQETVPLYNTYEDRIKELRDWARQRSRPASRDARMVELFRREE
ncbi:MAG: AAA family ATPase, partial [Myxococcota bacterium]